MSAQPAAAAPTSAPAPSSTSTSTSSTKPPVTLDPTTHLDPGAYVRGTHGVTIGEHTLIHPCVQLVAVRGPLSISDRCIIAEKSIIGGPIVQTSTTSTTSAATHSGTTHKPETTTATVASSGNEESDPVKTTIASNVYIHANANIHAGATIQEAAVVEPHVTVLSGVTVGAHSKICAGVTVDRDVEEWTVVYGDGSIQRRRRKVTQNQQQQQQEGEAVDTDVVETMRLKAMDKEREGTVAILRMAARAATDPGLPTLWNYSIPKNSHADTGLYGQYKPSLRQASHVEPETPNLVVHLVGPIGTQGPVHLQTLLRKLAGLRFPESICRQP